MLGREGQQSQWWSPSGFNLPQHWCLTLQVLSSIDKSRSLSGKDMHIPLPMLLERKRQRDAENIGTMMERTARSHQDGVSRGCSELPAQLFVDQSKSQMLYRELGASTQALSQTLWGPKQKPRNAQAFASPAVPKAPPCSPANPTVILSSCSTGFRCI